MPDAPKPKAYMVTAIFGHEPSIAMMSNACIAPSSEAAVAMCVALFCQESGTKEPIQGINCLELTEAFVADALTAIRGGEKPKVVSLREVEPPPPEQVAQREWVCICGAPNNGALTAHTYQCQMANQRGNWPPGPTGLY